MSDPIDRQAAIDAVGNMLRRKFGIGGDLAEITLAGLPPIEPERKRGQWIEEPNCYYRCSRCSSHYPSILGYMDYKYCPNCGADMREEQDE